MAVRFEISQRPYLGGFDGCKGENPLKEKWMLDLSEEAQKFVWKAINKMTTIMHW